MKDNLSNENVRECVQVFENKMFGALRIWVDEDQKTFFNLSDVCHALEIKNAADIKKRLPKRGIDTIDTPTQNQHGTIVMQTMTYIDEANLYRCIFQSRKAEAEKFQSWVFEEVLPQIRRTGGYIPAHKEEDAETVMARALLIAHRTIEDKDRLIAEQRPLAELGEAVSGSKDSILIRDLAKLLTQNGVPMGQNRLFAWLRQHGYLFQHETRPIQLWVERGIFDLSVNVIATHHGTQERITTRVTGKGQRYFLERMLREINGRDKEVTRTVQVQRD